jgi:hypothetical protein
MSRRVHSRYARRLTDTAIGGRRTVIRLTVRRIFCPVPLQAQDIRRAGPWRK